jgi:hypothetical protein
MKVLDNITDAVVRRVPIQHPLMSFDDAMEAAPRLQVDHHVRLRMELALRIEMTGPAEETGMMRRRAARMFLHQLYGEVADDLVEVLRLLYSEDRYRSHDDPVLVKLGNVIGKMRGERV